ncbi:hypothetical protein B7760_02072 [Burkholderia glumae]|uniref:hypothetical protein n=1 Tax=Burkholderia glumae TaxID=337 RepID=UPI00157AC8A6|nr:hypothetical protein [Burkholderia glumae]QKM48038.1 hypothetical protein B7760_02072 [Burkholderia glumae]
MRKTSPMRGFDFGACGNLSSDALAQEKYREVMSWHLGDWLSFSQAAASTAAVMGAFGVVFCQHFLEQRRRRRDERAAAWRVLRVASMLARSAANRAEGIEGTRSREDFDETPGMRARQKQGMLEILSELEIIPLSAIPTMEAIEYFIKVKRLARDALTEIDRCPIPTSNMACGGVYGRPWIRFRNELDEAARVLEWQTKQFGSGMGEPRVAYDITDF